MNTAKLRGIIAENGETGASLAEILGISPKTFYSKMKNGKFGVDEARELKEILNMSDQLFIEVFLLE